MNWGEDPRKWVVEKCEFSGHWYVWPPDNGDPAYFPTFEQALRYATDHA